MIPKVVLTTNGGVYPGSTLMDEKYGHLIPVDHINISRHHYNEEMNKSIFNSSDIITNAYLKASCTAMNKIGKDVTLSVFFTDDMSSRDAILKYIRFAKETGASAVTFRKPHGSLNPSGVELLLNDYKEARIDACLVCRSKMQVIEGMRVFWKCSVSNPSTYLKEIALTHNSMNDPSQKANMPEGIIYELIFHPDGSLSADWEGKMPMMLDDKYNLRTTADVAEEMLLPEGDPEDDEDKHQNYISVCGGQC